MHRMDVGHSTPSELADQSDRELLRTARSGDGSCAANAARDELTARYQPLVLSLASDLTCPVERDDVVGAAQVGLQAAINDYDLERSTPFAAYAKAKVRGEVLHWHRRTRYIVHVPRPLQELEVRLRRLEAEWEARGRRPVTEDLSRALGVSPDEINRARTVAIARSWSSITMEVEPAATEAMTSVIDLADTIAALDHRTRVILFRRYWRGESQQVVGDALGLSQAQVSRIEKRALAQLQDRLETAG